MQPGLSIIIVNYNSTALVIQCLHSFVNKITVDSYEVIVVDNDSKDAPEQKIKAIFPKIQFLQMGYNAGFARANNAGIKVAQFDKVLLINADTIVQNDAISKACYQLENSDYAAAGVQLLNADGGVQISGSTVMKGGLNYLLPLPYLGQSIGNLAKAFNVKKPSIEKASSVEKIDWINGAFLMAKKEAIEMAGLLDEDFFLYMEEIEWCSRLRKQGELVIYGNLQVVHLQGETTKDFFETKSKGYQNLSDKMGKQLMLSIWVRQRKEFGLFWLLFIVAAYGFEIPVFLVGLCLSKVIGNKQYSLSSFAGYTKNYFSNLTYLYRIIKNRPYFYKVL
jgi:GT2 family glycosyltransferase